MELLSRALAGLYFILPPAAAMAIAWRARKQPLSFGAVSGFAFTCVSGLVLGVGLCVAYAKLIGGRIPIAEVALATYVCIGVLCFLKLFSWGMKEASERLLRLRVPPPMRNAWWVGRATLGLTARVVLLFVLGLPYVMAVAMVYRPKVVTRATPLNQFNFPYQPARFDATDDGTTIDAWWIPAAANPPAGRPRPAWWGERTVILCHGLGADKANQLALVRDLVPNGYNVLTFDFRAHGASGGHVTTFGDVERRDVLGAVRWVRANRPAQSRQIYGLGVSMGGAALLAAAAEPTAEGRAIDKVAVYDTYDDLGALARSVTKRHFTPPLAWFAEHLAVPVACAHAGTNLADFSPAREADDLAPRPLLVIHGRGDEVIEFQHGVRLFDRASQPKLRLWLGKGDKHGHFFDRQGNEATHTGVIYNHDAANAVRLFFEEGESIL